MPASRQEPVNERQIALPSAFLGVASNRFCQFPQAIQQRFQWNERHPLLFRFHAAAQAEFTRRLQRLERSGVKTAQDRRFRRLAALLGAVKLDGGLVSAENGIVSHLWMLAPDLRDSSFKIF